MENRIPVFRAFRRSGVNLLSAWEAMLPDEKESNLINFSLKV